MAVPLGRSTLRARPLRIAHVDDDADLRDLVRVALESTADCEVASCASGREALSVIPAFHPDVILVDALMPDMDGLQTLRALRGRMSLDAVSVVFATGLDDEDSLRPLRAECDAVIAKPFDALTLAGRLVQLRAR